MSETKPRPDLIPGVSLLAVGRALAFGVSEHADRQEEPTAEMRVASAMRHLCACLQDRDAVDEQSGLPHLHSAASQLLFAIEKHQRESLGDEPEKPGDVWEVRPTDDPGFPWTVVKDRGYGKSLEEYERYPNKESADTICAHLNKKESTKK